MHMFDRQFCLDTYKRISRRLLITCSEFSFSILGCLFVIHEGFIFDGASLPFFLWWWVHPHVWWVLPASCVHDYIYRNYALPQMLVTVDGVTRQITRKEADRIFLQLLCLSIDSSGKNRKWRARRKRRAHIMYLAVRKFGWLYIGDGGGSLPSEIKEFKYLEKYLGKSHPATTIRNVVARVVLCIDNHSN
jgi:hypothetical protein